MRGSVALRFLAADRALLPGARYGLELLPPGQQWRSAQESDQPSITAQGAEGPSAWSMPHEHVWRGGAPHGMRPFSSSAARSSGNVGLSPLEALSLVLSPSQLGAQVWELGHSVMGLPWWASIPATTLAVRAVLSPLSAKARAASANWVLLDTAITQARILGATLQPAERRKLGGVAPVRAILSVLRARHGVPSWRWYTANALIQGSLFISLSGGLSVMCAALWPGMTEGGVAYFKDLTAPPLYPQQLATPYGTLGAVLPLLGVLMHVRAIDGSAAARAKSVATAARILVLPAYIAALVQPHAVLLYWLTMGATHLAIAGALSNRGSLAQAAGIPAMLLPSIPASKSTPDPHSAGSGSAGAAGGASEEDLVVGGSILSDPALLVGVGTEFLQNNRAEVAAACFYRAVNASAGVTTGPGGLVRAGALLGLARARLQAAQPADAQAAVAELEGLLREHWAGEADADEVRLLVSGLTAVQEELRQTAQKAA